jgi:hypothetical protein
MSDRKFAIFHCKILISLERQYYLRGKRPCLEYGVFCYLNIGARYPIGLALLSVIFLLCIAGFLDWCLMFTRKLLFDYSLFHQAKETTDTRLIPSASSCIFALFWMGAFTASFIIYIPFVCSPVGFLLLFSGLLIRSRTGVDGSIIGLNLVYFDLDTLK